MLSFTTVSDPSFAPGGKASIPQTHPVFTWTGNESIKMITAILTAVVTHGMVTRKGTALKGRDASALCSKVGKECFSENYFVPEQNITLQGEELREL